MSNPKTTRSKWLPAASLLIVLAGLWLPRSFQLDHFVTSDESRWLIRSGNFLHALSTGELEQTFQHGHPGVTIMWLGALGYQWAYPEYPAETPGQFGWKDDLYEAFIEGQGRDPLDLLAAGRWMVALANVVVLGLAFLVWRRLVGLWAGGLGLLLIAFDPFEMAFARFLHPDGLLYALMMLSVVGCLGFCLGASNSEGKRHARSGSREGFDARYGWLLLSGVAAGLAWLTKTPGLFLIPFCGLLLLIRGLVDAGRDGSVQSIGAHFQPLIVAVAKSFGGWLLVAVVIFVGCWPAMWVAPMETLAKVFDISAGYATGGHDNPIFFRGETFFGDPGMVFYPVTVIWRASPIVLLGLALGLVWVVASGLQTFQGKMDHTGDGISGSRFRNSAAFGALIGFVLLFGLFMNLGAKKFDRYLLPIYPMLALAAGLGWAGIGSWISAVIGRVRGRSVASRPALVALGICLIAGQAAISLPHFPYYISYYNPSIGGGEAAKSTLAIGWGEGMGEAARYLEQEATAEAEGGAGALTVASWHQRSPFGYFFDGSSIPLEFFWTADYAALYASQQQRQLPARQLSGFFAGQEPTKRISLSGTEYVSLYKMDELASSFGYTWQDGGQSVLQLVSYTLFSGTIQPGTEQELILHLVNVAAIDKNLNLLIRIVNQEGQELFRSDQWPFGAATKDWALGDLWLDKQLIPIPADTPPGLYRVEISFYDPSTLDRLPALSSESGSPVGDTVVLDYLTVGPTTGPSSALDRVGIVPIEPAVLVGEAIELLGAKLLSPDLASQGVNGGEIREENGEAGSMPDSGADGVSYRAGDRINIRLVWRATNYGTEKLTSFVHLVGPDGVLAAQQDRPPLEGFISTALWSPALVVEDDYTIALPNELASGKYKLFVGMYDSQSQQRLPINQAGEPMVDAFNIWTIDISSE